MSRFTLTVAPGARRTELVGRHGDGWKARVAAPPERGRANAAVVELVAGVLGLPRSAVAVVSGHGSRRKVVEVQGLTDAEVDARLASALRP